MAKQRNAFNQALYHYRAYAAAGQTSLTFFDQQVGGAVTKVNTNMGLAGQIPLGSDFEVHTIAVHFIPGVNPAEAVGAQAAANYINDMFTVWGSGFLALSIGQANAPVIEEGPLGNFPYPFQLNGFAAISDQTTIAAASQTRISYAAFSGPVRQLDNVVIRGGERFDVTAYWPTAVALPSTVAGRMGIRLGGRLIK